ncbi:MAG TPA: hypothetical protein VEU74_06040 [Gemmatimonadales bacterium]|nr:hypothetical protein [Gemmatimonadales bacterium]
MRQYVVKFADANRVALPFTPDPEGKLKERVTADHDLGLRLGVQQAPVIFAVTNTSSQLVQTPERLSQTIDDMLKHGIPAPPER